MNKYRLLLCLPMTGRNHDEIIKDINEMSSVIKRSISEKLEIPRHHIIIQHNYSTDFAPIGTKTAGCWFLKDSMKLMSYTNALVFHPNWEYSNGCKIEKYTADIYNIPQIFLTMDSDGFHMPMDGTYIEIFK